MMIENRDRGKMEKIIDFVTSALGFFFMVFIIGSFIVLMKCYNG